MKSWIVKSHSTIQTDACMIRFDEGGEPWLLASSMDRIYSKSNQIQLLAFDHPLLGFEFLVFEKLWVFATQRELYIYKDDEWVKVGDIEIGIKVFKWSPDQSVLVIITGDDKLLMLSSEFQVVAESYLDQNLDPEEALVSIGWGKKETQFHGSEGKDAARVKIVGRLSENDDGNVRVSWRGDAEYFVVSFIKQDKRCLKVYNRIGGLHSESEELPNLEHSLSWRPSGNWITSSQSIRNQHQIIFIERNGLKHREFSLRHTNGIVKEIAWNSDSTGLAIYLVFPESKSSELQFWTVNNYHWYLKHVQSFNESDELRDFSWDNNESLVMHYLTNDGYYKLEFIKEAFVSSSLDSENPGTVVVVDGKELKLTPFKFQNVPPPMCSFKLDFQVPVVHVSFLVRGNGDDMCVQLADNSLQFYKSNLKSKMIEIPECIGSLKLEDADFFDYRQSQWVRDNIIMVLSYNRKENCDSVQIVYFKEENSALIVLKKETMRLETKIIRLHMCHDGRIILQDLEGNIFEVYEEDGTWSCELKDTFPAVCPRFDSFTIGKNLNDRETVYIGLTDCNKLYLNQKLLSRDCTSFFVNGDYLLLTTFSQNLLLIPRAVDYEEFKISEAEPSPYNEQFRRVESGSQIVNVIPGDTRVVFQLPRGNLETVHPRALLFSSIKQYLKNGDYFSAFLMCRKHRLDMNVLIDFNPAYFCDNLQKILLQISNPDFINLLIAGLKDDDVTLSIYKSSFETSHERDSIKINGKMNTVCDLIISSLEKIDDEKYINSILTAMAKKSPPDLESATKKILKLKLLRGGDTAESAIKYLIFLVDANKLFDFALGVYDLELVLMVAQNSQKDPREYLSFLNNLEKMEEHFRKFTIDDHLGRNEKALRNLVSSGERGNIEKAFDYIQKHNLYVEAIDSFNRGSADYFKALLMYAEYLSSETKYEEAAALFLLANNKKESLECFKRSLSWQEAFTVAHQLNLPEEELYNLGVEIYSGLVEAKKYRDAAFVAIEYQSNYGQAIEILSLGGYWNEAVRIGMRYNIPDVIKSLVEPKMLQSLQYLRDDIREISTRFRKDKEKLFEVRRRNERKKEYMNDPMLNHVDLQSETSSMATTFISGTSFSNMSSRTARTAKQKRKMERKKAAGKVEAFQEEYLTDSLRRLVDKGNEMQVDIAARLKFMIIHGYFDEAKSLQNEFADLLDFMKDSIPEIFTAPKKLTMEELKEKWINDPISLADAPLQSLPPVIVEKKWKAALISR